jgi:WD40 repeat protein
VTTSLDGTARIWDAASGRLKRVIDQLGGGVTTCDISPDGELLLLGGSDGDVGVWNIATGEELLRLPKQGGFVMTVRFCPDTRMIGTASNDGKVLIHEPATGALVQQIERPGTAENHFDFIRGSELIAISSQTGVFSVHDRRDGSLVLEAAVESPVFDLASSPTGDKVLVGSRNSARVFSVARMLAGSSPKPSSDLPPETALFDDQMTVYGLTSGREPTWNQRERIWNTATGLSSFAVGGRQVMVTSRYAAFSPDRQYRFEMDPTNYTGLIRETSTGAIVYQHRPAKLAGGVFTPDGRKVAVLEAIDRISILEVGSWKELGPLSRAPGMAPDSPLELYIVAAAGVSPDSRLLVVPYLNGRLTAWDLETMSVRFESEPVRGIGSSVAFSTGGDRVVIGGNDGRVTMWESATGRFIGGFEGHSFLVHGASFNPAGDRVLSFSRDRSVRLWEAATQREILTLFECDPSRVIVAAQFLGDGRSVVVLLDDGTIIHLDAVDWNPAAYPDAPEFDHFNQRFERYLRRKYLSPTITVEDVLRGPVRQNL